MINKSKELTTTIKLVNDRLNFIGTVGENTPISIDYIPPIGDNLGYTSLELFLLSLTSCLGSAVLTFLRKMNKAITNCEINATGTRRVEHPTGFKEINVDIKLESENISENEMLKVIKMSEETYCPVISMIKGNVNIKVNYKILNTIK